MSSVLLQLFVKLGSLHVTSNHVVLFNQQWSLVLIPLTINVLACSQNWTCNLQIIVTIEDLETNMYNRYGICPAGQPLREFFGLINLMSLHDYDSFYLSSYTDFFI